MSFLSCNETDITLDLSQEKQSMLIVGGSRMGKTYFMSQYGNFLMQRGDSVHVIDLGDKWSVGDKARTGIVHTEPGGSILHLYFPTEKSLLASAKYIANAMGYSSGQIITILKSTMKELLQESPTGFTMSDLVKLLEAKAEDGVDMKDILVRFDCTMGAEDVLFVVNPEKAIEMTKTSIIWDLSQYEEEYNQIICQLIIFVLYETQKLQFHEGSIFGKLFVFIDEFQNIPCNRGSVLGKCLTEGQKCKMFLVLATQFLQGRFSEAVINQFKQGGFQLYFRLTEEEAYGTSKRFAYKLEDQKKLYESLTKLKMGNFFLKGPHYIGNSGKVRECLRVVRVNEWKEDKSMVSETKPTPAHCTVTDNEQNASRIINKNNPKRAVKHRKGE